MTELRADVLVVGGGPAGAMTAWELAASGVDVLLVDRAHFPRDKVCSEYLSPEASRLLARMGALDEVESAGAAQLVGMKVRSPRGHWVHGEFAAQHGFRGFRDRGLALRRKLLDQILLNRARDAGARVAEGMHVTDLSLDDGGRVIGATARNGAAPAVTIRARMTVGADGLRSVVARRLGVARRARWPARVALVAHYSGIPIPAQHGEMHVERDGYLGLAPVGNGLTNVALVVPRKRLRGIEGGPEMMLAAWIERSPLLRERFQGAARVTPLRATGPFAVRVRRAWVPGAAVVGDAADFFDPFTGEGIYAALRGGEILAPLILEALSNPQSERDNMREYDRQRRAEFGGKWIVERLIGAAVACPPLMNRVARALAARRDLADLLVGVSGDFVPPRELLRARFVLPLLLAAITPRARA